MPDNAADKAALPGMLCNQGILQLPRPAQHCQGSDYMPGTRHMICTLAMLRRQLQNVLFTEDTKQGTLVKKSMC